MRYLYCATASGVRRGDWCLAARRWRNMGMGKCFFRTSLRGRVLHVACLAVDHRMLAVLSTAPRPVRQSTNPRRRPCPPRTDLYGAHLSDSHRLHVYLARLQARRRSIASMQDGALLGKRPLQQSPPRCCAVIFRRWVLGIDTPDAESGSSHNRKSSTK